MGRALCGSEPRREDTDGADRIRPQPSVLALLERLAGTKQEPNQRCDACWSRGDKCDSRHFAKCGCYANRGFLERP